MKISIQNKLREMNMSKAELSRKLEVSYPTVLEICNGTAVSIRLDTLEKLCRILQCTPNDILIFENNPDKWYYKIRVDKNKANMSEQEDLKQHIIEYLNQLQNLNHDNINISILTDKDGNDIAVPTIQLKSNKEEGD